MKKTDSTNCPKCGTVQNAHSAWCPACGADLVPGGLLLDASTYWETERKLARWPAFALIALGWAMSLGFRSIIPVLVGSLVAIGMFCFRKI